MNKFNFSNFMNCMQNEPNNKGNRKSHIPFRLNILFFIIFGLFIILIAKLGTVQIVDGEKIQEKMASSSTITVKGSTPRGTIYDSTGKVLVSNEATSAITFTRGNKMTAADLLAVAEKLNQLITVEAEELTERDKKDYWLADEAHLKEADDRIPDGEKVDSTGNLLSETTLYELMLDEVTDEEIQLNEEELKVATIFKKMNSASALNTVNVKNKDVTDKELAVVAENASDLPGVSTGTDWIRNYEDDDSLRPLIGTVSSEKAGLPEEDLDEYLEKGYERNDRVGTSYLEKAYEDQLKGTKTEYEITLDSAGNIKSQKETSEGEKGNNLVLTIDSAFNKKVEEILQNNFQKLIDTGKAQHSKGIYATVLDPNTGAVLATTSIKHDLETNELTVDSLGSITDAVVPGSAIKGAMVSTGYKNGVITGNDVIVDEPIKLAGSAPKASIFNNYGSMSLTTEQALEYSSNVYMMKLVLRMLGIDYTYDMVLPYEAEEEAIFDKVRSGLAEYGLGVTTGIDLPAGAETTGLVNKLFGKENGPKAYNLLDLSFGQYDTYSALQMAQYVATVANGGKRIAPHLVEGIYDNDENGELGNLIEAIEPTVLNEVSITDEQMQIIQNGFYKVVHGNGVYTTGPYMQGAKWTIAAKTGTAESFADGGDSVVNSNAVAYAPYEDPQIAISVLIPEIKDETDHINQVIVKEIVDAYYDMYVK